MKKIFFWILVCISLVVVFKIGNIFIFDFKRLTEFGLGYLTGLIITLLTILGLTVFAGYKIFKKNEGK